MPSVHRGPIHRDDHADTPDHLKHALSDPERVCHLLTSAGFTDVRLRGLSEPMYFGPDPDDACRFVSTQFAGTLNDLEAAARARVLDALRADMAEHRTERGVLYDSAAWITVARRGPG